MEAAVSVESLCNLLVRSRLLPPSNIRTMHQRWKTEAKDSSANVQVFGKWLIANKYITDYQWSLLLRGKVDNFFLHDYKILDRLGQGRFAGIYECVHSSGQRVAIKVLPPSKVKDAEVFGRFQREARLAVKFKHPNIVRTFQWGQTGGLHYIVMEYLDGDTLEEILQRRKLLAPAESARLVHQALLGLQHIHEQGMVHRDMKPANLMLVPSVSKGKPDTTSDKTLKILDIGLGRALFDEGTMGTPADNDLTGTGAMLGTPEYLAPEQARNAHTADIRADIYSLGCTLYHCLTGRPPFTENNPVLMMVKHATEAPRPLRDLNPNVPDGLQPILNSMLAKDPAQRYPTPDRAAQALQVFLQAGQDSAPQVPEPQMQAYLKWLEANPGEAAFGVGVPGVVAVPATPISGIPMPVAPAIPAPQRAAAPAAVLQPTPVPIAEANPFGDVELVAVGPAQKAAPPAPVPPPAPAPAPAATPRLGKREMIMLGFGLGLGLGAVVLVVLLGWLMVRWVLK
ncbi:MAG: serine/threonine protein kinase [Gemmataceae bacterium]|nr:serine/threonine protein kinase [Gemmataceae bacterium]